jgi:NAD(P)-dependent dehydrogenase (short-subunit alcohol dehydrogenase family)
MLRLDGRVAIVTGGAGILGRRFCSGLAEFGAKVVVVDLDAKTACESAAALTASYGAECIGIGADVAVRECVAEMVSEVMERFGRIDILHNNAASKSADLDAFFAPYEEYSLDEWRSIMSVNIDGMFLVSQAVGREMVRAKRGGSIVQTASIYGVVAPDQRIYQGSEYMGRPINTPAVYAASKAAVVGLTKYLAAYWASERIRVNTLTPGGVESGQNEEFRRRYSNRVPMGRMADADELVGALIYLASDASTYVTGQNIIVDGGLSAW